MHECYTTYTVHDYRRRIFPILARVIVGEVNPCPVTAKCTTAVIRVDGVRLWWCAAAAHKNEIISYASPSLFFAVRRSKTANLYDTHHRFNISYEQGVPQGSDMSARHYIFQTLLLSDYIFYTFLLYVIPIFYYYLTGPLYASWNCRGPHLFLKKYIIILSYWMVSRNIF